MHGRAARWFEGRDLVLHAEHLDRAAHPTAPQAYLAAARAQAARYHYERAKALIERGLALATNSADRFALTCFLGELLHDLGAMAESRAAYEGALEAAADDRQRAPVWLGLAAVKRVTDDPRWRLRRPRPRAGRAAPHGRLEQRARILFLRGNLCFPRGDIAGCLAEHDQGLATRSRVASPSSSRPRRSAVSAMPSTCAAA